MKYWGLCLALSLILNGCAGAKGSAAASPSSSAMYTGAVKVGLGVACSYLGQTGPPSYFIRDIGKKGVPVVNAEDMKTLRKMLEYVHPSTLRFAYLQGIFSVFDATDGPCSPTPVAVLTAPNCNAIYVPYDGTGALGSATGCNMQPRPWIPGDLGNPHGLSWNDYPNSQ